MTTPTFLSQWTGKYGVVAQGPAKRHEFLIYVPPLLSVLKEIDAREIVDFQADEGVVSAEIAQYSGNHATFVLPRREDDPREEFRRMAEGITAEGYAKGQISLVASTAEIETASADAIVFSNILGCQGCIGNIDPIVAEAARIVKPQGHAVVTVPNPDGGTFSSYVCSNLPKNREHGGTYHFQMEGAPGAFINLYLTKEGLSRTFLEHGFHLMRERKIADLPWHDRVSTQPAFIQYLFQKPA